MSEIIRITDTQTTEAALKLIAEQTAHDLQIAMDMACTEETKQACKNRRAELRKQFDEYEAERKEKTAEYEKPLKAFKVIYDKYIKEPFQRADTALGDKIKAVESQQKADKAEAVKVYAEELKAAYGLVWLDSERIMPPVTLSVSEKKLKEQVKENLDRVKSDTIAAQIDTTGETLAEYMITLNLAQAHTAVNERRKAVEMAKKAREEAEKQEEAKQETVERVDSFAPPIQIQAEEIKTYSMTFTVSGTIEQLKALKAFMINNNITFTNGGNSHDNL